MQVITGNTQVFGILADPIHHVKTPQRINSYFEAEGFDGVMVPIHVKADGLQAAVSGLRAMHNLAGCVVTVPHKTAMVALCDEVTADARLVGAVNVVHRTTTGKLIGTILDGEGFVAGLRQAGIEPAGRSAYLAGAGGAASAIAFALARAGVSRLTVANRTSEKVHQLFARIHSVAPHLELLVGTDDPSGHDLVVNGTSLGLAAEDALPLDVSRLQAHQVVAEIIMQPAETALLKAAQSSGCRVHYGAPMLISQIALMASFMRHAHTKGVDHAS
ncbi:shikimate dehydrogenase [Rhodoferax sp.]|uniref:shikimate dehydrogenase family protein n=1 Tax=Rhodoferax sp. TaxID=50421 RepID=UPI0025D5B525|nr:shikimate dehydrogenase [Rhodoferax sp.]MCM2294924.1 shikimate dehydrogenase [Rhodoferax sp.]MDD3937691.1 shikimate dehydrogenase [Rhodoferax sp.]